MFRAVVSLLALLILPLAAGCSTPCDPSHTCVLQSDQQLCDGTAFVACGADNRNESVKCIGTTPRWAVCSTTGWIIQQTPP